LKALLVFPEVPRDLDHTAIHYYLSYIWSPSPHTMLRHVRKLEPGHRLVVKDGRVTRCEAYYDLSYDGTLLAGTPAEHEEGIRERLALSVKRQMMGDVPVGAFLSGGVDSSAIVAMMSRARGEGVRCYTIQLEDEATDENANDLPYARLVAARLGADLREVRVRPDLLRFTERMVYMLDEPQADPACINVYLISEQARADGYKVLLSGAGGDDIFSGYRRHKAVAMERFWGWLPAPLRRLMAHSVQGLPVDHPLSRRVRKYFTHAGLSTEDRLMAFFLWITGEALLDLYAEPLRAELGGADTFAPLRKTLARIPRETSALNRLLYLEGKHFLPDHNLNYTDKMSMAHGVEVRVPLLDLDLAEYAIHLPPGEKQRGLKSKNAFKRAVSPFLPPEVISRPKTGFGAPLRQWIRQDLNEMVRDVLSENSLAARGLFNPAAVQRLILRNERREVDASYIIFSLMCIELWMRNFTDQTLLPGPDAYAQGGRELPDISREVLL
jgi:asparagine synthase (glutamine-hydrolysing)